MCKRANHFPSYRKFSSTFTTFLNIFHKFETFRGYFDLFVSWNFSGFFPSVYREKAEIEPTELGFLMDVYIVV